MIFFRKVTLATVGKASHLQQGFYWAVPTATTSGYNWATPFLSEYKRRRHSDCGRKMMGMIFLTDDFSYLSSNMVSAIAKCEVAGVTSSSEPQTFSWRALLPTLASYLNLPFNNSLENTRTRSDEATINLVPEHEQLNMLCKLISSAVLNRLAMNDIKSFDEVHAHQWKTWTRDAMKTVQADNWEAKPCWSNPDVQGYEDQPSKTRGIATDPGWLLAPWRHGTWRHWHHGGHQSSHIAPGNMVGRKRSVDSENQSCVNTEQAHPQHHEDAAAFNGMNENDLPVWLIGITIPSSWAHTGQPPQHSTQQRKGERSYIGAVAPDAIARGRRNKEIPLKRSTLRKTLFERRRQHAAHRQSYLPRDPEPEPFARAGRPKVPMALVCKPEATVHLRWKENLAQMADRPSKRRTLKGSPARIIHAQDQAMGGPSNMEPRPVRETEESRGLAHCHMLRYARYVAICAIRRQVF